MVFSNNILLGASSQVSGGYIIEGSAYPDGSTGYLSRTLGTPSDATTFVVLWEGKRVKLGSRQALISAQNTSGLGQIEFTSSDKLRFVLQNTGGSSVGELITTAVYRDPAAYMQVVATLDGTNGLRLFVDGYEVTAYDTETQPSLPYTSVTLNTARSHEIFRQIGGTNYFNSYTDRVALFDGLTITDPQTDGFGQLTTDGYWQILDISGLTFGTNGFLIEGGTNIAAGTDSSGNGNDFTPSGTITATNDSPTDDATNGYGNYATPNPLNNDVVTFSNGNLTITNPNNDRAHETPSTLTVEMPIYWEVTRDDTPGETGASDGIVQANVQATVGDYYAGLSAPTPTVGILGSGAVYSDTSLQATYTAESAGATRKFAYDPDSGKFWVGVAGGSWFNSGDPAAGTGQVATLSDTSEPVVVWMTVHNGVQKTYNFGQTSFVDTPPTGFKALATQNITPPAVVPSEFAEVLLWNGTGASQTITGTDWGGDDQVVFGKHRNLASSWNVFDSVRGATKFLEADTTKVETTDANTLTAFNDDGFDLGADTAQGINRSGYTTMGLRLRAGTSGSNTDGSITATVSANTTSGFSIVTYTGTGSNATVGHGLGVPPSFVIIKRLDSADNWFCYHKSLGNASRIILNSTNAEQTSGSSAYFQDTTPTSSVVSIGTNGGVNANTGEYVMYCFADVADLATSIFRIGSYTGNASTNGPVTTHDASTLLRILKQSSGGNAWYTQNTVTSPYNPATTATLSPNSSAAEDSSGGVASTDFLSNGVKTRATDGAFNASGGTYVYLDIINQFLAGGADAWTQGRGR